MNADSKFWNKIQESQLTQYNHKQSFEFTYARINIWLNSKNNIKYIFINKNFKYLILIINLIKFSQINNKAPKTKRN